MNTIWEFETGRYGGTPEIVAKIQRALEASGLVLEPRNAKGPEVPEKLKGEP